MPPSEEGGSEIRIAGIARAADCSSAYSPGEGASVLEAQNDLGQTIRGLLLLGIFVVLPVTAAVFPSVCRLAWREAVEGVSASADTPGQDVHGEAAAPPAMSLGGTNLGTKPPPQERSAHIPAEVGNADMAAGWAGGATFRDVGGGDPADLGVQAIATPGAAFEAPSQANPPWTGEAAGLSTQPRSYSRETSVEGWPDRNSIGPGYAPPGARETSFNGMPQDASWPSAGEGAPSHLSPATADLERRLQSLGAVYYRMEKWGADGRLYRFYCDTAVAGQAGVVRHWEAVAEHPESAMIQVLSQIEAAAAEQGM